MELRGKINLGLGSVGFRLGFLPPFFLGIFLPSRLYLKQRIGA